MSSEGTLIVLGIVVALLPFSGLPFSWFSWLLPVGGLLTALVAYFVRSKRIRALHQEMPVVESTPEIEQEQQPPTASRIPEHSAF